MVVKKKEGRNIELIPGRSPAHRHIVHGLRRMHHSVNQDVEQIIYVVMWHETQLCPAVNTRFAEIGLVYGICRHRPEALRNVSK